MCVNKFKSCYYDYEDVEILTIMSRYVRHGAALRISFRRRLVQIGACHADESFWGKVLGVPSQIRRSASASIVLLPLLVSIGERYLRPNLPGSNRVNRVKRDPRPVLNYWHLISLNEERYFRFMASAYSICKQS